MINTVYDTDVYLDEIDKMNDIKVPPFTDGLKEIIEATEKHKEKCDKISTNVNKWGRKNICDVDGIDDDITDLIELLEDTISRIEGLTNEEWLRSCNTEQLAEWIFNILLICSRCGDESQSDKRKN